LLAAAGPKAVDPLLGMLKDADWQARWVAVQALGRLRDRRAIAPLIEALADPHFYVRKDAGEALEEIAGRRYGADAAQWREWYEKEGRAAPGGVSG
jgi:HEAT repeat protein